MKTKVIFRKFPEGDIIALFPQEPGTLESDSLMCYQHIGQHGATYEGIVQSTSPANPSEYADLQKELQSIGYDLDIRKKITYKDFQIRNQKIRGIN